MEIKMFMKKLKEFQKVSYLCLTLLSTVCPSTTEASDSNLKDYRDQPVVRTTVRADRQGYRDLHNRMVEKYAIQNPELERHRLPPLQEESSSTLVTASEEFARKTEDLRKDLEKRDRELQQVGVTAVKATAYGAKELVEQKVKNPEAKSFFLELLDKAKDYGLNLFKQ